MYGDFSRDSFRREEHFRRVLLQQGRVLLDADFNEQTAIILHRAEHLARALASPFAAVGQGFHVARVDPRLSQVQLEPGSYYVDGLLCEHEPADPAEQWPIWPMDAAPPVAGQTYLLYLAAWERYVDASERHEAVEQALGGAETTGRSKVEWRVRRQPAPEPPLSPPAPTVTQTFTYPLPKLADTGAFVGSVLISLWVLIFCLFMMLLYPGPLLWMLLLPLLALIAVYAARPKVVFEKGTFSFERTRTHEEQRQALDDYYRAFLGTLPQAEQQRKQNEMPALTLSQRGGAPSYAGGQSLLYRVEIHSGGDAGSATFKWSRNNGATTFPVCEAPQQSVAPNGSLTVIVSDPQQQSATLRTRDWVELVALGAAPDTPRLPLLQIAKLHNQGQPHAGSNERRVTLTLKAQPDFPPLVPNTAYILRVWDHTAPREEAASAGGALIVQPGAQSAPLEGALELTFSGATFRPGDHWTFTVRRGYALPGRLVARPAAETHYAPLALVAAPDATVTDLRLILTPLLGTPAAPVQPSAEI